MASIKKPTGDAPEIDPAALVPERPKSKVEAGLAAEAAATAELNAAEVGQAMLAEDVEAMEQLIAERVQEATRKALIDLGVPEDAATAAAGGDVAKARELVGIDKPAAPSGEICLACFPEGWNTAHAREFTGVGCAHGHWTR